MGNDSFTGYLIKYERKDLNQNTIRVFTTVDTLFMAQTLYNLLITLDYSLEVILQVW